MLLKHICIFLACISSLAFADEVKPFKFDDSDMVKADVYCKWKDLKLPKDYVVLVASTYAGRKLGFRYGKTGFEASQVDVAVNYPDAPVVLMFGAYNPVIWNVGWTKKTKIAAVILTGYERQMIAGIDSKIPVMMSTGENKNACGYFYEGAQDLRKINGISQQLLDRDVNIIYPITNNKVLMGKKITNGEELITSSTNPPEKYYESLSKLRGNAGIDYLLKNGFLRFATVEELLTHPHGTRQFFLTQEEVYEAANAAETPKKVVRYRTNNRAFVVLKSFIYPAGLDEGGIRMFITPVGGQAPTGFHENSIVVDLNPHEPPVPERPGSRASGNSRSVTE